MIFLITMFVWAQEIVPVEIEESSSDIVIPSKSDALYATAKRLFDNSAYEDAVDTYLLLMQNSPPLIAYKELALSYQFLGAYEDAITFMSYYKEEAPESEKAKVDKIILHLQEMQGKMTSNIEEETIPESKELDSYKTTLKIQKNIALGLMITGGAVGGVFQYQAYQSRTQLNTSCVRVDTHLVCPSSVQELRADEKKEVLYSSIGWGLGALGFLSHTFFTLKHGNSISVTTNSIHLQGRF
jgi:hypothetical protein